MSPDSPHGPELEPFALPVANAEEDAAVRIWVSLSRCYASYSRALAAKVQEYGLTMPQFRTAQMLYHLGPMSHGELAEKLLVTGGNVTYVMDTLQEKGLATRQRCLEDRRIVTAALTDDGRALLDELCQGYTVYLQHLSRHLREEDREAMPMLLTRLGKGIAVHDL